MFANLNGWELVALGLLGLFIFGPDRLPKTIADGIRMLRGLRSMARKATTDLSSELGTEVRLEDLDPKTFIRQHLLSAEEEAALRRPFDDLGNDLRQLTSNVNDLRDQAGPPIGPPAGPAIGRHRREDDE